MCRPRCCLIQLLIKHRNTLLTLLWLDMLVMILSNRQRDWPTHFTVSCTLIWLAIALHVGPFAMYHVAFGLPAIFKRSQMQFSKTDDRVWWKCSWEYHCRVTGGSWWQLYDNWRLVLLVFVALLWSNSSLLHSLSINWPKGWNKTVWQSQPSESLKHISAKHWDFLVQNLSRNSTNEHLRGRGQAWSHYPLRKTWNNPDKFSDELSSKRLDSSCRRRGSRCILRLMLDDCGQDTNISTVHVHVCVYVFRGSKVAQVPTVSNSPVEQPHFHCESTVRGAGGERVSLLLIRNQRSKRKPLIVLHNYHHTSKQ